MGPLELEIAPSGRSTPPRLRGGRAWSHQNVTNLEIPQPWPVRFSGLSAGLRTKGSSVQFPVREQVWVGVHVPSRGCLRGTHTLIFPSLPLSKNK